MTSSTPEHFKDKDAIGHVAEAQAQGIIASTEIHGIETPGYISAAADAARETALMLAIIWPIEPDPLLLSFIACGWALWKGGRSAWLGWFRLERLHRILEQERWEIEHHRQQEREELKVLYAAKGFEGKLLEEVLDVLMADDNRLLKVMVEEELGLSLACYEHPLKQGLGAFLGAIGGAMISILGSILYPHPHLGIGISIAALLVMGVSGAVLAAHAGNRWIPAIIWNVGLGCLALGCVYFLGISLLAYGLGLFEYR